MGEVKTILFVCTGNTCRSFMAENLAQKYLSGSFPAVQIISAGTGAYENDPPSPQALQVMREKGLEVKDHRARLLTPKMVEEADLVLVMTTRQKEDVLRIMPEAAPKVHVLKEYARDPQKEAEQIEEARLLAQEIESKKQSFWQEHGKEIEDLQKRRRECASRLAEIERELAAWEERYAAVAAKEEMRLSALERDLYNPDIMDPFGQTLDCYRACAGELEECISRALHRFLSTGQ